MIRFLLENWRQALTLTGEHLYLVAVATGLAVLAGVPLGIFISVRRQLARPVLDLAGVLMTVPSIALFGLMMPLLAVFNAGLGNVPAITALVLYSQLPIIRNTYTAIMNIDEGIIESARGMGLSPREILRQVKLPLALPVIIAGVRIAVVMNIGILTIGVYIGADGLGKFIQRGIDQAYREQIMAGALLVSLLAVVIELAFYLLERRLTPEGGKNDEGE